jgi:hypothetical protein
MPMWRAVALVQEAEALAQEAAEQEENDQWAIGIMRAAGLIPEEQDVEEGGQDVGEEGQDVEEEGQDVGPVPSSGGSHKRANTFRSL